MGGGGWRSGSLGPTTSQVGTGVPDRLQTLSPGTKRDGEVGLSVPDWGQSTPGSVSPRPSWGKGPSQVASRTGWGLTAESHIGRRGGRGRGRLSQRRRNPLPVRVTLGFLPEVPGSPGVSLGRVGALRRPSGRLGGAGGRRYTSPEPQPRTGHAAGRAPVDVNNSLSSWRFGSHRHRSS